MRPSYKRKPGPAAFDRIPACAEATMTTLLSHIACPSVQGPLTAPGKARVIAVPARELRPSVGTIRENIAENPRLGKRHFQSRHSPRVIRPLRDAAPASRKGGSWAGHGSRLREEKKPRQQLIRRAAGFPPRHLDPDFATRCSTSHRKLPCPAAVSTYFPATAFFLYSA
ncbi:hypothetical protein Sfum_0749 [Syntrophobacter fumaroxidans MPOB]|uniref:Uncharacterized protein n=1 Tax=Syntrophobacter fumaroxidans (strain DSM 10017 / MPOB) TaxID=335543 RepID=A0LG95_SYNFM|nr:hypothetical protein Sfum_0749 [Syntrophobacter fumaroxidans MPOB]